MRTKPDDVDFMEISQRYILSENIIREFKDWLHWDFIGSDQKLSEEFIIEHLEYIDWYCTFVSQKLSDDFISKYRDKVVASLVSNFIYDNSITKRDDIWNNPMIKREFPFLLEKLCNVVGYAKTDK